MNRSLLLKASAATAVIAVVAWSAIASRNAARQQPAPAQIPPVASDVATEPAAKPEAEGETLAAKATDAAPAVPQTTAALPAEPAPVPAATPAAPVETRPAAVETRPAAVETRPAADPAPAATPVPPPVPAKPSFLDDRELAAPPAPLPAIAAGGEPKQTTASQTAPALPTFRDSRPLTAAASAADGLARVTTFHDPRPLAVPSMRDPRAVGDRVPEAAMPAATLPARPEAAAAPAPPPPVVASAQAPTAPAAATLARSAADPSGVACGAPAIETKAVDGGRMQIRIASACRADQTVQLGYGGATLIRTLDATGRLDLLLDCFVGTNSPVVVDFGDGTQRSIPVQAGDLAGITKVALIWRAPVNLDLHAFEYTARPGETGHVWAGAASSPKAARELRQSTRRGRGFLSTSSDQTALGDKIEVYTYLHDPEQLVGLINFTVDFESRGDVASGRYCGSGELAEIAFQSTQLSPGGKVGRELGVLTSVDCGNPIPREIRFGQRMLPTIKIRK